MEETPWLLLGLPQPRDTAGNGLCSGHPSLPFLSPSLPPSLPPAFLPSLPLARLQAAPVLAEAALPLFLLHILLNLNSSAHRPPRKQRALRRLSFFSAVAAGKATRPAQFLQGLAGSACGPQNGWRSPPAFPPPPPGLPSPFEGAARTVWLGSSCRRPRECQTWPSLLLCILFVLYLVYCTVFIFIVFIVVIFLSWMF